MLCENCSADVNALVYKDARAWCWSCHNDEKGVGNQAPSVIGDDIPGGIEIRHGLCNPDGSPRKYYSKSEMAAEAKKRNLTNIVEHVTSPGTDKNPYTQRWI